MDDQRRFILTIAVVFGFLFVWFRFVVPKPERPSPEHVQTETTESATPPVSAVPAALAVPAAESVPAVRVSAETPLLAMAFSTVTGGVQELVLKEYRERLDATSPPVTVVPFFGEAPPPLSFEFEVGGSVFRDGDAPYEPAPVYDVNSLSYQRDLREGLAVKKTWTWDYDKYDLILHVDVTNSRSESVRLNARTSLGSGTAGAVKQSLFNPGDPLSAMAYVNEKTHRLDPEKIASGKTFPQGDIGWVGFGSRYFLLGAVPVESRWASLQTDVSGNVPPKSGVTRAGISMIYPARDVPGGGSIRYTLRLFAGPKDIGVLGGMNTALDRSIDLGNWIGWIARPMLHFLRWLYGLIPNYGVAIILLTVVVRLLMFPLAQVQAKSMRKMQEHKPQLDALKEKYKDDKEAHSREMMSYMRSHRINPMGGCLMMLPQLPVWFALYRVLYNSIELRHAPFLLWIRDLAAHDPYFVTPVLMGAVMFVQTSMMPAPGVDPMQQKMMKFMPVMFSVFMLMLPAGLNLYILVSTLWGIGQQYWVQRGMVPVKVVTAKKRAKANE